MHRWVPQSIIALRHYNRHTFISDAIAGVTVGLVALPLAMAFAISSGMAPQAGTATGVSLLDRRPRRIGGRLCPLGHGPSDSEADVVARLIREVRGRHDARNVR